MIAKREIIEAMCVADISNKTLTHKLSQYVDIKLPQVDEIIRVGVKGWLEPFVAWILGLKKYIPEGFNPPKRKIVPKPRQYILGINFDHVTDQTLHVGALKRRDSQRDTL